MSFLNLNLRKRWRTLLILVGLSFAGFIYFQYSSIFPGGAKLPEPPFIFPFDAQQIDFKVEKDIRIKEFDSYEFKFSLKFKEGDIRDQERVEKLTGGPGRNKAGQLTKPGINVPVRIRIRALKPSDLENIFEKEIVEEPAYGVSAEHYYKHIINIKLKPGTYHLAVENLEIVPELIGTPLSLLVTSRSKTNPIVD